MAPDPTALETLCALCEQQLQRFQLRGERDTASCDEILRRAATHDEAALTSLVQISEPLVRRSYRGRHRSLIDEWTQEVLLHIVIKLRNRVSPYVVNPPPPPPFVAYRGYLKITGRNLAYDQFRAEARSHEVSLEHLQAEAGDVVANPRSEVAELETLMRFERLLELIRKPLDREIFRVRFALGLAPDETVETLTRQGFVLTKDEVFRSVERSIRALSALPEVRALFEE